MEQPNCYNRTLALPKGSFIALIHYNTAESILYVVLRRDGRRYRYRNVPPEVVAEILKAKQKGAYIAQHVIKSKLYPCEVGDTLPRSTLLSLIRPKVDPFYLHLAR